MCCFTQEVARVAQTRIFARAQGSRQTIAYSMTYEAAAPLAMVLPLPVPPGSPDDAVRFIDLSPCPEFFDHLREGFPRVQARSSTRLGHEALSVDAAARLKVVDVGQFEASFVPAPADFGRLDERFRLPLDLWLQLGTYADWGFAVFKLKEAPRSVRVHPMAFDFPRRDARRLFFPTLHIHERRLESAARFDHELYCQPDPELNWHLDGWEESWGAARRFVKCDAAWSLLDARFPVWRLQLAGLLENADTWLGPQGRVPAPLSV
jgi:hypothetical protein